MITRMTNFLFYHLQDSNILRHEKSAPFHIVNLRMKNINNKGEKTKKKEIIYKIKVIIFFKAFYVFKINSIYVYTYILGRISL